MLGSRRTPEARGTAIDTSPLARTAVSLLGTALLAAGAFAVFLTTNSAGASTLIAAGTVLISLALFANRLQSVEGGGFKLQLGAAVAAKLREAGEADATGDTEGADRLRREAQRLLAAMEPLAERYEEIREGGPASRARSTAMSDLVQQAQTIAKLGLLDPAEVEQLFRSNEDGSRVMALGLMRGDSRLASLSIATQVVRRPRSSFEQFQALRVCEQIALRGVTKDQRQAILDAIETARQNGTLITGRDYSRENLSRRIEDVLRSAEPV